MGVEAGTIKTIINLNNSTIMSIQIIMEVPHEEGHAHTTTITGDNISSTAEISTNNTITTVEEITTATGETNRR